MRLQGVSDEIMCRAFPTNLRGSMRVWFNQLETRSIDTFTQLSWAFIDNFIGGRRSARPGNYLLNIQQREGESLRSYDAFEARDEFISRKRKEPEDQRFEPSKGRISKPDYSKVDRKNAGSSRRQSRRPKSFTPLNMSIDQVFLQIRDDLALSGPGSYDQALYTVTQRPRKNMKLDDQIITFSEDDARGIHQPHDDALVVTMTIAGFITRQVLIDNGSSTDIIYLPAYQQIKIDKEWLRPIDIPLMGFTGDRVKPSGVVSLIIEAGTYPKQVRASVEFLIVDCPLAYNVIISRELKGDQATARECYYFASLGPETRHQTIAINEGQKLIESTEKLEVVVLDDKKPDKTTNIGTKMDRRMRKAIIEFLKGNLDVFAWTHEDMPDIDPSVISHKLNVELSIPAYKAKKTSVRLGQESGYL
uniref:Retrotransposon gag domain-containing protein n=1 Tax=Fagus sylvatica TaxID=28930 RepID=A0A2N9IG51_FAGSY